MMLADGDKRKALLMQKKKRDFDYLTTDVLMEQQKHLLASIHFKASSSGISVQTDFIIVLPNRAIIVVVYLNLQSFIACITIFHFLRTLV